MVFYKKHGFPGEGEIVLCKVKKILPHSVFAEILEYDNIEGMIHISEISNRWTKNIHDLVNVGKLLICRVEKVNTEKGYIDLSKKRVTSGEEKKKKNDVKNENRIEKLIEHACNKNKTSLKDFYEKAGFVIVEEYESLFNFFENFKEDSSVMDELNLDENLKKDIITVFESLLQKSRVTVKNSVKFFAEGSNGLNDLKSFIKKLEDEVKDKNNLFEIVYINAPEYLVSINSSNYKEANAFLEKVLNIMKQLGKGFNITFL